LLEDVDTVQRVGSYALIRRIGSGGMGEVWLGRHVVSGNLGAVKRIATRNRGRDILAAYFVREGKAVARLDHPHIVPLVAIGRDHLVTAYIDGGDLARRLQTPMSPAEALRIARQIADALAHAHERGVVHRDVKPSNVLLDRRGNAYLSDFGLAAILGEAETFRTGAGTPWFMAPEQRHSVAASLRPSGSPDGRDGRDGAVGPAADQYALGRTLLEMLVGGRVSVDRDEALRELPAHLPERLGALVARATAYAPGDRFPSMAALGAELADIDAGTSAPPRRLATERRDAAPFAWLAGSHAVATVGPDVQRADFRLRDLAAAGLLPVAEVEAMLARTGLADLGFSAWGSRARLGSLRDPRALARASDVAILLHGFGGTREVWASIARAVCRDNAQAIVLAPDVHGFGESRFARRPTRAQAQMTSLMRAIDDWRRLLGVAAIPTALVGHSMSGLAVLTVDDDAAGLHVARVAITPAIASRVPELRRQFRMQSWIAGTLGRIDWLRGVMVRMFANKVKASKHLVPEAIQLLADQTIAMPGGTSARIAKAVCIGEPARGGHRRLAVVIGIDDPLTEHEKLGRIVEDLGVEPAHVLRMPDGGHYPHVAAAAHPEWTARNTTDLVRLIDTLLVTAGESSASDSPTAMGSTLPAFAAANTAA
jgi:hypothetical protein